MNPSRHVLHTPVPCRPQPIKSSPITLPWPLSDSSDWVSAAAPGTSLVVQPSSKLNLPRFPNLITTGQQGNPRKQGLGSPWHKQSTTKSPAAEPTVLFRLRSLSEHLESQIKPQEKKEIIPQSKAETVPEEGSSEVCDAPLDLSDRGKSKTSQSPRNYSPIALQVVDRAQSSPDKDLKSNPSTRGQLSPYHITTPSSASTAPAKQHDKEPASDHKHKVTLKFKV